MQKLYSLSKDLQLESNAFFFMKDTSAAEFYNGAKKGLSDITSIRLMLHDSDPQRARMDSLEMVLGQLISFSDSFLLISQKRNLDIQRSIESKLRGNKFYREKIRGLVTHVIGEEERQLFKEQQENEQNVAAFERTFMQLLATIGVLLATTFFSIRYNFNKRIRVQHELRNAKDLFGKLFYESPIGLVITRQHDGIIVDCNQAYADLVQYTREELKGKSAIQLKILNYDDPKNDLALHSILPGKVKDVEVWLKPKHSDPIWASISVQAIQVQEQPCLLNAISDLTAHKRAEDEIRKALDAQTELNKMKSDFVTLASHEFRTPLTTIQSSSFILGKYASDEFKEKVGRQLSRIKSAINSMTLMLDEFLSLSKIEEGEIELQPNLLNVREYISNACDHLKNFTKPGQNIIFDHEGEDNYHIDKSLLGNIMDNLVSNAIKYSPENSNIYVKAHVNNSIHLTVKDDGIGIPLQDQKHLFERFFRASNAGNVQGTGLGLHILKRYVELANGSVEVQSEVGKGTEIKVTLENH
ncbi:PAS domain-containing sensor histidine kinase [Chryseolinea sp. H1M3-3]|uniref:sensor histidine kinase n=1 Tax=Chryseolinea sp. H1M3-3 TaxID=3034144 RepID=UPI0023EE037D|nr:PAS domain-containing sensor histidine kinase [Chryseolinea sp. H1M3-3]